ncbi:hypothetical protein [Nonomuraea sp. NPDC050643]|uniref:hypothetical protein n=1 Tax=Nonomuraea sp. NPDC050643 TaxID=3155660 RepID=UPI0033DFD5E5
MKARLALFLAAAGALALGTGCRQEPSSPADTRPLPSVAASPFVCGHVPADAVARITGVRDPLVRGFFDLTSANGLGDGSCTAYEPDGERPKVLSILLDPTAPEGEVAWELRNGGAKPMPQIVPGAEGYYVPDAHERTGVTAVLVRGHVRLSVVLLKGVEGRDKVADVVALMRLIAPKLVGERGDG